VASRNSPSPDDTLWPWTICQSNDCIRAKMPCLARANRMASIEGSGHALQESTSQQLQQQQNGPQTKGPQHSSGLQQQHSPQQQNGPQQQNRPQQSKGPLHPQRQQQSKGPQQGNRQQQRNGPQHSIGKNSG
jgi:hypothetical protein